MGTRRKTKPVLVLGIGNILMKDDGIGVHVANRMMESGDLPGNVEVIDGGTAGFDLIPLMSDREKIIIIDALSMDDAPGSVYRFRPDDVDSARRGYSLHEVGIMEVIRTLRMMGGNPEIEFVGIVTEDISTLDISLSDAVMGAVPKAVSAVMDAVTS
ncbi:MAG: HyaD/HybD family hydrogenase maturation endopeptidase [Spirochaetes bacterium]|jgi:hydrogenase maturation protease|nr:HyaD/HybD family hydrogenase maturation endopeptidase [Spirochaetota bacterium]